MLTRSLLLRKGRVDTGRKGKSRKCTTTVQEVDEKGALRGGRMFAYVPDKSIQRYQPRITSHEQFFVISFQCHFAVACRLL